jgi:hypothetical protein
MNRYNSSLISSNHRAKLENTGIFKFNPTSNSITWNIPLWEEETTTWIKNEYCSLFQDIGKKPYPKECTKRMITFLKKNPDVTKEEIITATKAYIRTQDTRFIREPHYFINKGVGSQMISDLYNYIEQLRQENTSTVNQTDITQKIQ